MRLALTALASLLILGCASQNPKAPDRAAASAKSSLTLNIQPSEIKDVVILDDSASTVCKADNKIRSRSGYALYSCATTTTVGVYVKSSYLNIDQVYGGLETSSITGYRSRNELGAESPDDATVKEIADVQANSLNAIGRRYRKLADGCMGDSVILSYGGDKIDLQTGEYFGDLRCRIKRKNAKLTAGGVYYLEATKAAINPKLEAAGSALKNGATVLNEIDNDTADTIGWLTSQAMAKTTEASARIKESAVKSATYINDAELRAASHVKAQLDKDQAAVAKALNQADANLNRMAIATKQFISAQLDTLSQLQQRTRTRSAEILRMASDNIRP